MTTRLCVRLQSRAQSVFYGRALFARSAAALTVETDVCFSRTSVAGPSVGSDVLRPAPSAGSRLHTHTSSSCVSVSS